MSDVLSDRPEIEQLAWDDWNRDYIAKHRVTPAEVEELVEANPVSRGTYKQRIQLIGPTRDERMLSVIVGPVPSKPGFFYTFSARPALRQERAFYRSLRETSDS